MCQPLKVKNNDSSGLRKFFIKYKKGERLTRIFVINPPFCLLIPSNPNDILRMSGAPLVFQKV